MEGPQNQLATLKNPPNTLGIRNTAKMSSQVNRFQTCPEDTLLSQCIVKGSSAISPPGKMIY